VRRVASTDGVSLAVHHLGGTGEPLLICHATGFHGRAYEPLARALTPRFQVWAMDFRGHGASTPPASLDFSWTGMGHDVLAVVDDLGRGPVRAVGHSMGGCAILLAAAARPEVLTSAYLFEPIVPAPGWSAPRSDNPMAGSARRRRDDFTSREEALMRYATRPGLSILRADALAAYVVHGFVDGPDGLRLACRPDWEARTFEATGQVELADVTVVGAPVVVATGAPGAGGSGEGFSVAGFSPPLAAALPRAELIVHHHLGHFGPLQDPDFVAAEILANLA